jgi:flavin-binding protein dodecin
LTHVVSVVTLDLSRRNARTPKSLSARLHHHTFREDTAMAVARVTEIIASSTKSFDDAIRMGIARANKTLKNVKGAWIQDQKLEIEDEKIVEYRVNMKVTFVLEK